MRNHLRERGQLKIAAQLGQETLIRARPHLSRVSPPITGCGPDVYTALRALWMAPAGVGSGAGGDFLAGG